MQTRTQLLVNLLVEWILPKHILALGPWAVCTEIPAAGPVVPPVPAWLHPAPGCGGAGPAALEPGRMGEGCRRRCCSRERGEHPCFLPQPSRAVCLCRNHHDSRRGEVGDDKRRGETEGLCAGGWYRDPSWPGLDKLWPDVWTGGLAGWDGGCGSRHEVWTASCPFPQPVPCWARCRVTPWCPHLNPYSMPQGQRQRSPRPGERWGAVQQPWAVGAISGCGGMNTMCTAAERRGKVLRAGQECSSPHPPPASSHDMWTIIKMPALCHWEKANAQCKREVYWWKGIHDYAKELERCAVKGNRIRH